MSASHFAAAVVIVVSGACFPSRMLSAADRPDFDRDIAPLLILRCVECHQGDDPSGGLSLTSEKSFRSGGDSGAVVNLDKPGTGRLLQRILDGEMPPEKQGQPQHLAESEVLRIRHWIEAGARWPQGRTLDFFERTSASRAGRDWWSLQPVVRPAVPQLTRRPQPENPIDAFVLARLEQAGMSPAPEADRRTLIRRLYYDLIGLPPTEEQIAAFVADESADAWIELIDDLLTRPQYGERWARYWLDLVRYADTSGYERDQEKPFAWKYRDWVVTALNTDMPYAQFVTEQIAGDEIENRTEQSVIATGFLRLGAWNDEPNIPADYQYDRLEDLVHTTSAAFLGLTVKCARCHSHKFDPIYQDDYYRMASAFWAGPIARSGKTLGGPTAEEVGFPQVLAWTDVSAKPAALHVLKNGERAKPLNVAVPASLSSIPALEKTFAPPPEGARTTHRRFQLAQWIADPENPLTPRVLVNRIWQHHFGEAIVRTPNNFGFLADPPTHPQLLDWLAAGFTADGGHIKQLHRLILTSRTWRQSSLHPEFDRYSVQDSTNRLIWRADRKRLNAEALRDSMLAASGELELTTGGPGFKPTISPNALEGLSRKTSAWQASPPAKQNRRSLYIYLKRGLLPPLMTTFDLCDPTLSCGQRNVTIVPTQALALLNNRFIHDRSETIANGILKQYTVPTAQVQAAWSQILKRQPTPHELKLSLQHVAAQQHRFSGPPEAEISADASSAPANIVQSALQFHLRADMAKTQGTDNRVVSIEDLSGKKHHASQPDKAAQPVLVRDGFGGRATLHFDGKGRFLKIAGRLLTGQHCTLICVVNDDNGSGHRAIISNWNGSAGNSTSSLFLGLTGSHAVRFSDAFAPAGHVTDRDSPFIITSITGSGQAAVFQNSRMLSARTSPLATRRLDTEWVIGQQGNINGEFWTGGIAEVRVYNRALSGRERRLVEKQLAMRYGLTLTDSKPQAALPPDALALASLCHALLNSNEFLFVD